MEHWVVKATFGLGVSKQPIIMPKELCVLVCHFINAAPRFRVKKAIAGQIESFI